VGRKYQILVCKGPECGEKRGSIAIHGAFERELRACPLHGNEATLEQYSCFGRCQRGPNVLVREVKPGENTRMILLMPTAASGAYLYHGVSPDEARAIVEEHVGRGQPLVALTRRKGPGEPSAA
jgi:(2Fe-2S) ferredoxin